MRPLSYANANVFLLCFSVISPVSFENVTAKVLIKQIFLKKEKNSKFFLKINQWYPELMHFCPDVPFILVGTKLDMRNDKGEVDKLRTQGQSPITTEQGTDLARKLKAIKYMECSAKTQENLKDVFGKRKNSIHFILTFF